jgi:hypothetical protein
MSYPVLKICRLLTVGSALFFPTRSIYIIVVDGF